MPITRLLRAMCCLDEPRAREPQAAAPAPVQAAAQIPLNLPRQAVPQPVQPNNYTPSAPPRPVEVLAPKPPPGPLQCYRPSHCYTPQQLLNLVRTKGYGNAQRLALLEDLAMHLYNGQLPRMQRIDICLALSDQLTLDDDFLFQGQLRGAEFFDNTAIDLMLAEFGSPLSTAHRARLANAMEGLLQRAHPDTEKFNIQGVPRRRAEVRDWVTQLRQPVTALGGNDVVKQLGNGLNTAFKTIGGHDVHNRAVIEHGNVTYMQLCHHVVPELRKSVETTRQELLKLIDGDPQKTILSAAIHRLCNDRCANSETRLNTDLPSVLSLLWSYISLRPDPVLKTNLQDALKIRLLEIGRDRPCHTGCLERLLDVPSGIDHALSVFNNKEEIRHDVAKIAGQINENFHALFEGTELADEAFADILDPELVANLKKSVFEEATHQELSTIRGLAPVEFKDEVTRMGAGFA